MQPNDAESRDTDPDKGHDSTPTTPDTSHPEVLGVAAVALILGVSPRTVQRRCHAGKLSARRVLSDFGEQWEIDRAEVEKAKAEATTTPPTNAATTLRHVAPVSQSRPDDIPGEISQSPTGKNEGLAARYIARLETENDFLRATVEQHQRSEAELRAALREALKAQPRQLTSGTPEAAPTVPEAPTTAAKRPDEQRDTALGNGSQIAPDRAETSEVDFEEIQSLIKKVFGP